MGSGLECVDCEWMSQAMTTTTLNFVPASITVNAVAGATLAFSVAVNHADGTPFDLTGYTITAPIVPPEGIEAPVGALTAATTDVGVITLSLDDAQTLELGTQRYPSTWFAAVWLEDAGGERTQIVRIDLHLAKP
jgi:hypothetical protein